MNKTAMTPEHKRWKEFYDELAGPRGCDVSTVDELRFKCDATRERPRATKILEAMGDIDVPGSLRFFDEHGGYCDCEILWNVN